MMMLQANIDSAVRDLSNEMHRQLSAVVDSHSRRFSHSPSEWEVVEVICGWMARFDEEIRLHGERTALHTVTLGRSVGLAVDELVSLHHAAILHDIGKLALPKGIYRKEGPVTGDEYALIECHPRYGARILQGIPFLQSPATWIAHHHERWDGYGYPYGLRNHFIPLASRILAVADTFDALSSEGPFGCSHSLEVALSIMEVLAGSQLDPTLVEIFASQMKRELNGQERCQPCKEGHRWRETAFS